MPRAACHLKASGRQVKKSRQVMTALPTSPGKKHLLLSFKLAREREFRIVFNYPAVYGMGERTP
ncbi:MAG: hypothetical protein ISS16_02035 [Ignavibacteria bacterium]|nr:hypothetical protein [Ignavibacteria bacterium]